MFKLFIKRNKEIIMPFKKQKVLFLVKRRQNINSYGYYTYGLLNSAKFVSEVLSSLGHETKVIDTVDGNTIDADVSSYNPDQVIIEAIWATPAKMLELLSLKRHQSRIWNIRTHSKLEFLAHEGNSFESLFGYRDLIDEFGNLRLSANSKEFVQDTSKILNLELDYLPNIYKPQIDFPPIPYNRESAYLDVSCFGAIRPFKNHLNQAIAAILYADQVDKVLRFHVNSTRVEQRGEPVLKNLVSVFDNTRHELVAHEWVDHNQFLRIVNQMDLAMQVSFTETFNITLADGVVCSVPVVASPQINWINPAYQAQPNDINDIIKKLKRALRYPDAAIRSNRNSLNRYNDLSLEEWKSYLYHVQPEGSLE
jgi:hypothetical protein